jgi:YD repeat-containing protein
VQLVGGETAALPYTIWMPPIDTANAVWIESPTTPEVVIPSAHIPGLELHLPRQTVITDRQGEVVREVSITRIPVDRPPFPLPAGVEVPVYFTIQPRSRGSSKGTALRRARPKLGGGGRPRGVYLTTHAYEMGRATADGRQAVPDPDVALSEFTGAMFDQTQSPGPDGGNGSRDGDPVELGTAQFVLEKTDLALQDVIPLALTRTYRSGDSASRPFGIGATHPYAIFLWFANPYQEADLILPDGKRIHYVRTSPGTGYADAVFDHTATPGAFHTSAITWNGAGWDLTTPDGTVYVFGDAEPLQAIRDRFGNTVQLTWDGANDRVTKVTSPTGRFIEFTYDGFDRITQAKDNIGRTVGYEYDASGRLWTALSPREARAERVAERARVGVGPHEH